MESTIIAISTALSNGGIGIIRLSGDNVFEIMNKIFIPKNNDKNIKGYTMKYGHIVDNGEIIDEVLVSYFVAPKSYTTENMCEINTHGGLVVERKILEICLRNGANLAEPGEFTKRAFLNGRIDLSQAEAIIDLINSKSEREAKESINQLEGQLSNRISTIEKAILDTLTAIEVTIDYPEYDIDEVENRNVLEELSKINDLLDKLKNSFNQGKLLKNGIKTVILGRPNAGKSSLLNAILKEERAIVSNIEGTTRDTIEEFVNINGIPINLIDTAGIRNTENEIERIGVERAKSLASKADLIIAIFDITADITEEDKKIIEIICDKNAIVILNKIDIANNNVKLEDILSKLEKPTIKISAKNNDGVDLLYVEIEKMFNLANMDVNDEIVIMNERHKDKISRAKDKIEKSIEAIKNNLPIDICSIYIKDALEELGEITGKNVSEDIINEIFKNFCLGK